MSAETKNIMFSINNGSLRKERSYTSTTLAVKYGKSTKPSETQKILY